MSGTLVITTAAEGLQPLGSPAQRSWELLSTTLATRLGPEFGGLLAEPVAAASGDRIDWYAPDAAQSLPLNKLSAEDAAAVGSRLSDMRAQVEAQAAKIEESGLGDDLRLAEALRHAIQVPDDAMIFARRDTAGQWQPLLVHWAWSRGQAQSVQGGMTVSLPRAAPATVGAATTAGSVAFPWLLTLGWVLLALMLAAILWLSFAPCALNPFRPGFCPAPEAEVQAVFAETAVLEDETARLEREIALADRLCQPGFAFTPAPAPAPVPEAPAVEDTPEPEEESRLEREGAQERVADRGGEVGDLNFILEWDSKDDVDLFVTCPGGAELSFLNRQACGGHYDVDSNVVRAEAIENPVENVVFDPAIPGLYKVRVHLRSARSGTEVPVRLHVVRRDGPSISYDGKVGPQAQTWTLNISISK